MSLSTTRPWGSEPLLPSCLFVLLRRRDFVEEATFSKPSKIFASERLGVLLRIAIFQTEIVFELPYDAISLLARKPVQNTGRWLQKWRQREWR